MLTAGFVTSAQAAPVRLWGDISSIYRQQDFARDGISATNWLNLATMNASSYIWHPWFALVSGSLTFSSNESKSSISDETSNESIAGTFQFNLFPTSRFPFLFYIRKNEIEQDNILESRTSSKTTIGLRQQYTSVDGKQSYIGHYERIDSDSIDLIETQSDTFDFAAIYQLDENYLSADLRYEDSVQNNDINETDAALTLRHSYTGKKNLSLENLASTSNLEDNFINSRTETANDQITSFLSWRPEDSSDLIVTGNLRISEQQQTFSQIQNIPSNNASPPTQSTMNISQGLIYNLSQSTTIRQSINLNQNKLNSTEQFNGSESAGISYSPPSIPLDIGIYSWSTGVNLSHSHGDDIESSYTLGTQISHSLSKDLYPRPDIKIQSSFNQSAGYTTITDREDTGSLSHSAALGWNDGNNSRRSSVRLTASDSRNFDDEEANFQLINLQINNDYRYNRHTHIAGELTFQKSNVRTVDSESGTQLISGQVSYTNNRFMNWHGLRFRSELSVSEQKPTNTRDIIANDEAANNTSWENDFVYRIGLFESRLSLDYIKAGSQYDRIIIIQLTRNFGDL